MHQPEARVGTRVVKANGPTTMSPLPSLISDAVWAEAQARAAEREALALRALQSTAFSHLDDLVWVQYPDGRGGHYEGLACWWRRPEGIES